MQPVIQHIRDFGSKTGYHLNMAKGKYLMAKRNTPQEANNDFNQLVALGLSPDIIVKHPDNVPEEVKEEQQLRYGSQVLGSYIGTKEFIRKELTDKLNELEVTKNKLLEMPSVQLRLLLLRKCYALKINHLLRTLEPGVYDDFIDKFQSYEKEIVNSIIVDPDHGAHISQLAELQHNYSYYWNQCKLPVNKGGLGLTELKDVQYAAYTAAFLDSLNDLQKLYPDLEEQLKNYNNTASFATAFRQSVEYIANKDTEDNVTLETIFAYQRKPGETVQNQLSTIMAEGRSQHFMNSITNFEQVAWTTALQNDYSGKWLDAIPKHYAFQIDNTHFRVMLRYRLNLPQFNIVIPGVPCDCNSRNINMDIKGHHLATQCPRGGYRQNTHDSLKSTLERFFRWCGQNAKLEEIGCFHPSDENDNCRPDITLTPSNVVAKKLLIDIRVTSPVKSTTHNLTRAQLLTKGREAVIAAQDKTRHYATKCAQNNLDFCPAIFESTGYIGCELIVLLTKIIKNAALIRTIPEHILSNYLYTSLSVCLQYNLAKAIIKHSFALQGRLRIMHNIPQHMEYRSIMSSAFCTYC